MQRTTMKTITLPSGKIAEIGAFKGKHILQAKRMAGDDAERVVLAMIAICTKIDGKEVLMEDLEEMDGFDVLQLMGEFSGVNPTSAQAN